MAMTRKDYELIAHEIRTSVDQHAEDDDIMGVIAGLAHRLAGRLSDEGGLDINGNRRFKRDKFLDACGV